MNIGLKNLIIEKAKNNPEEEICGFIYLTIDGEPKLHECRNAAEDKAHSFLIDPQEYIKLFASSNTICGIYHSHVLDDSSLSDLDLSLSEEMELPVYLYSLVDKKWNSYTPMSYHPPLSGRPFCWGISDCYEQIRDYYRIHKGIKLSDYDRDEQFCVDNPSIILDKFESEGFFKMPGNGELRKDDVIIFKSNGAFKYHLGVFIGNSRMFHQPNNRLSEMVNLNGHWLKQILMVLRHE